MIVDLSIMAVAATLLFVVFIRTTDLQSPEPTSPTAHLHERKSAIHQSLRDLQFDFRTGKLSQADYQASKLSLQSELAAVLLLMRDARDCASCGETFSRPMKFCGNCGKATA